MKNFFCKSFIPVASVVLSITSFTKLTSVFWGSARLLESNDPVFSFLKIKYLLLAVSLAEFLTVVLLVTRKVSRFVKLSALSYLSLGFLAYRFCYWFFGIKGPCKCMGSLTDWLPVISPDILNNVMMVTAIYLFVGSYICLFFELRQQKQKP